jgi:hypothetical protein
LREHGVRFLLTYSSHPEHDKYLKKIGFRGDHKERTGKKVYKMALPK